MAICSIVYLSDVQLYCDIIFSASVKHCLNFGVWSWRHGFNCRYAATFVKKAGMRRCVFFNLQLWRRERKHTTRWIKIIYHCKLWEILFITCFPRNMFNLNIFCKQYNCLPYKLILLWAMQKPCARIKISLNIYKPTFHFLLYFY